MLTKLHEDSKEWEHRVRVMAVKVELEVVSLKFVQFSPGNYLSSVLRCVIALTGHHIIFSAFKFGAGLALS